VSGLIKRGTPFCRLRRLLAEAAAAHGALLQVQQGGDKKRIAAAQKAADEAHAALLGYRSRGHGRAPRFMQRSCMSRTLVDRSKYSPDLTFRMSDLDRDIWNEEVTTRQVLRARAWAENKRREAMGFA
jgi:hypothetical protein